MDKQLLIRAKSALERGRDAFANALWRSPIRDADETLAEITSVAAELDAALAAADDTPSKSQMSRVAALAQDVMRDRELDRQQFSDIAFNHWLDEGISDVSHTVWDAILDTGSAWEGWSARASYSHPATQGEAVAFIQQYRSSDGQLQQELVWDDGERDDREHVPLYTYPPQQQQFVGVDDVRGILKNAEQIPQQQINETPVSLASDQAKERLPGFIKPDNDRQVFFYEQDFYVLSNFSAFNVEINGQTFETSEAAYHWFKFPDAPEVQLAILHARSAHEAFKIAEGHKHLRRADWDAVKAGHMLEILREKAEQHEYVRRKLLATGDRELIEDSWRDDFWGWGQNRDGQNMLGKLWMRVRAELREAVADQLARKS